MHFNSFFHFSKQKQDRDKRLQAAAKKTVQVVTVVSVVVSVAKKYIDPIVVTNQ
jgi:hypothetical protein